MKISRNLYVRVALSIAFVAVLVSMISSVFSYYTGLQEKKNTNYLLVQQLGQTIAKGAAISAYVVDIELGQEIVNGLVSNDLVKGVILKGEAAMLIEEGIVNGQQDSIVINLFHPFIPDSSVGTLTLFPDDVYIQHQAQKSVKKEIGIMLSHSIIIAFFVSLVVHRWLTRPIQNLTDSFAMIDPSVPETMQMLKVRSGKHDEIGKLTVGINSLMQELHLTISNERALREKTQELESKFRLIFEQASAGICLLDEQNMITTFNPAFERYFTAPAQQRLASLHFPTLLNDVEKLQELLHSIRLDSTSSQITLDIECRVGDKSMWLHCLFAKLTDQRAIGRDSQSNLVEVILHDVTERAEREFQTRFEADHDALTHLLNRRSGEKKLHKALFDSLKKQHHLVLMMIDLDKFKPVNDTFGHEAGDKVLIEVSRRLTSRFNRVSDICIRWGGDEFIVGRQFDEFDHELVKQQANDVLSDIMKPIYITEYEQCEIGASIGIVVGPQHGKVLHELMVNADNTMYQVKDKGRGQVAFYQKPY
ncbi:sensor domain-containing diguanylate cyclase [Paraglaciecola sp.]|uniref:sensor domain-containing diguanylate cyclase n=1 Tax=Paraglaciecola sp. TaxID=1920173 RepID=UPI00273D399F|nr:sensor domain-containing diguanylate cyclase [Paraglaciecola sp.]MDP5030132.1 diguanylate cyclase [Paraglaciecola sp.]